MLVNRMFNVLLPPRDPLYNWVHKWGIQSNVTGSVITNPAVNSRQFLYKVSDLLRKDQTVYVDCGQAANLTDAALLQIQSGTADRGLLKIPAVFLANKLLPDGDFRNERTNTPFAASVWNVEKVDFTSEILIDNSPADKQPHLYIKMKRHESVQESAWVDSSSLSTDNGNDEPGDWLGDTYLLEKPSDLDYHGLVAKGASIEARNLSLDHFDSKHFSNLSNQVDLNNPLGSNRTHKTKTCFEYIINTENEDLNFFIDSGVQKVYLKPRLSGKELTDKLVSNIIKSVKSSYKFYFFVDDPYSDDVDHFFTVSLASPKLNNTLFLNVVDRDYLTNKDLKYIVSKFLLQGFNIELKVKNEDNNSVEFEIGQFIKSLEDHLFSDIDYQEIETVPCSEVDDLTAIGQGILSLKDNLS